MENSFTYLLRTAWNYSGSPKKFVLVYSFYIFSHLVACSRPIVFGWFVNSIQGKKDGIVSFAWIYIAIYLGVYLLEWLLHGPAKLLEGKLSYNIGKSFVSNLYNKIMQLPLEWHQDHHTGDSVSRIRKGETAIKRFVNNSSFHLGLMVQFVTATFAMIYFSPLFATVAIIIGVISSLAIVRFDRPFVKYQTQVNEGEYQVNATMTDSLSNVLTVITLKLEKKFVKQLIGQIDRIFSSFWKTILFNEGKWFTAGFMANTIYCIMVIGYVHSHYVPGEVLDIGGLVTLLGFIYQFTNVFMDVGHSYNQIIRDCTDVRSTEGIHKSYLETSKEKNYERLNNNWKTIEIEHLSFSHVKPQASSGIRITSGNDLANLLLDISIRIERGQRIAIIGNNGSGKTTLMSILKGLYTPESNSRLIVDGKEVKDWRSLADIVTLLPQHPQIFENTIRYNLTLGLQFSESEIETACNIADFSMVLKQFPEGLDYKIQENGSNLSGGQKQRMVLARAILASQNSSIILLDEFTSNIDHLTEGRIYRSLFDNLRNKVLFCSVHETSLLEYFDLIYILEKGGISFKGTFNEFTNSLNSEQKQFQPI